MKIFSKRILESFGLAGRLRKAKHANAVAYFKTMISFSIKGHYPSNMLSRKESYGNELALKLSIYIVTYYALGLP